jgi:putative transport protein
MPTARVAEVSAFFGDSEKEISELDYLSIAVGITLGLLCGMVPIPLGDTRLAFGIAGGPLLVALVLGRLGRTGRLIWSIPFEANMALRHVGLLLFLAGVGVASGGRLVGALSASGLRLFVLGAAITAVTTAVGMVLLRTYGRASVVSTMGATAGLQTQPATLSAAREIAGADDVYASYAVTYPMAMIVKILLAQVLVAVAERL